MKEKHLGTILVLVVALIVLFLIYKNINFVYAALILGGIGVFIPWLSQQIHWLWMKFAEGMGYVMNRVILSIVFFIFLVPIAFLSRLFRKAPATIKKEGSYFTDRNLTYDKKSLEEPW